MHVPIHVIYMTNLIRKIQKLLNLIGNEIIMKVRNNFIFCKITQGFGDCFKKSTQDEKAVNFIAIIGKCV